ncbi:hypothetical protein T492DRAFT_289457 [Pavlovales sp. CCMP2436]|nr:hypothetical protein T492DRAFT_289457 [Pavlovales sp. CCMP2436]
MFLNAWVWWRPARERSYSKYLHAHTQREGERERERERALEFTNHAHTHSLAQDALGETPLQICPENMAALKPPRGQTFPNRRDLGGCAACSGVAQVAGAVEPGARPDAGERAGSRGSCEVGGLAWSVCSGLGR